MRVEAPVPLGIFIELGSQGHDPTVRLPRLVQQVVSPYKAYLVGVLSLPSSFRVLYSYGGLGPCTRQPNVEYHTIRDESHQQC